MKAKILKVGLTGGMGCGKSEVRRRLARVFPTIDADAMAKEIAVRDPQAAAAIRAAFGDDVYDAEGNLQTRILASRVFGHPEELAKLNRILHPRVMQETRERIKKLAERGEPVVIIEAALFYETGWDREMDRMVVVTAPLERRLAWLSRRDGATKEAIEARLAHQMPLEEKERRADYVLNNDGTLEDLDRKIEALVSWIRDQARMKT